MRQLGILNNHRIVGASATDHVTAMNELVDWIDQYSSASDPSGSTDMIVFSQKCRIQFQGVFRSDYNNGTHTLFMSAVMTASKPPQLAGMRPLAEDLTVTEDRTGRLMIVSKCRTSHCPNGTYQGRKDTLIRF